MRAVHINCLEWQTVIYAKSLTILHVLHIVVTGSISDSIKKFFTYYLLIAVCIIDLFVLP